MTDVSEKGASTRRMEVMTMEAAGYRVALPCEEVVELVGADAASLAAAGDAPVLDLRGALLPVVGLARALGIAHDPALRGDTVVVVKHAGGLVGLAVDVLHGTEELQVAPMPALLSSPRFLGSIARPDGTAMLVASPENLLRGLGIEQGVQASLDGEAAKEAIRTDTVSVLLCRAGPGLRRAVPVSLVHRVEQAQSSSFEQVAGGVVLQSGGKLIRVGVVEGAAFRQRPEQAVVIVGDGDTLLGLAVDEVLDIVDAAPSGNLELEGHGSLGAWMVGDDVVDMVDVAFHVPQSLRAAPSKQQPEALAA